MPRKLTARAPAPAQSVLRKRVEGYLRENRFAQALELAKQLQAQEPGEPSLVLLRETYLRTISNHIQLEKWHDAKAMLEQAIRLDGPPTTWLEPLASQFGKVGDFPRAKQLLDRVPGTTLLPRVIADVVDRSLRQPGQGRNLLPPEYHAGYDAIVAAFGHYEKGDDEAARLSLQAIGLQSPFLDWKLLLRGLMAWATNDDSRAIENWQKLDPQRLPTQIAAPLRFAIDPAYRGALTPALSKKIAARSDHLSMPLLASLRSVQRTLSSAEHIPEALRQMRPLMPMLKMAAPLSVPKLASCFYWLIAQGGHPSNMPEYTAVFGPPSDDPNFYRMIGTATELGGLFTESHKAWKQYAEWIASQPARWPGEFGKRARAIIYLRMGDNALEHEKNLAEPGFDFFNMLRRGIMPPPRESLHPSAEDCFRKAMELAAEWDQPLERLLELYIEQQDWVKAEEIGKQFVARFPNNIQALTRLAEVQDALGKTEEAQASLRAALQHNPLDKDLRSAVALSSLRAGRLQGLTKDYARARASFQEAQELAPKSFEAVVRAARAACEFKAGNRDNAEAIITELKSGPYQGIAAAYLMMVETTRLKSGKTPQAEAKKDFDNALSGPLTLHDLSIVLYFLSVYGQDLERYYGYGAHEKKILARGQTLLNEAPSEDDLVVFGFTLGEMKQAKLLKSLVEKGRLRFPNNPAFNLLEGLQMIQQRPKSFDPYRVGHLFAGVLDVIHKKSDERSRLMREKIDEVCEQHRSIRDSIEYYRSEDDGF